VHANLPILVVGLDAEGEEAVGLSVFVGAINQGLGRQHLEFAELIPHFRRRALE